MLVFECPYLIIAHAIAEQSPAREPLTLEQVFTPVCDPEQSSRDPIAVLRRNARVRKYGAYPRGLSNSRFPVAVGAGRPSRLLCAANRDQCPRQHGFGVIEGSGKASTRPLGDGQHSKIRRRCFGQAVGVGKSEALTLDSALIDTISELRETQCGAHVGCLGPTVVAEHEVEAEASSSLQPRLRCVEAVGDAS